MPDENLGKIFKAYLDDAEGLSDEGHIFTVIAGVLIRDDLSSRIELKLEEIWERYMPGFVRCVVSSFLQSVIGRGVVMKVSICLR